MGPGRGLAVVLLAGATVAGCGGGGGSPATVSTGLSRTALAARADAICRDYQSRAKQIRYPAVASVADTASYNDRIAGLYDGSLTALEAIKPATGVSSAWDEFLAAYRREVALVDQIRASTDGGRTDVAIAARFRQVTGAADTAASTLGAKVCAAGGRA